MFLFLLDLVGSYFSTKQSNKSDFLNSKYQIQLVKSRLTKNDQCVPKPSNFIDISQGNIPSSNECVWACDFQVNKRIYAQYKILWIFNSKFKDISDTQGGAIYIDIKSGNKPSSLTSSNIINNTIQNCVFENCKASSQGGAIYMVTGITYTYFNAKNCSFNGCSATTDGGAIYYYSTGCCIEKCTFINNDAKQGAHIYYYKQQSVGKKCLIIDNVLEQCNSIAKTKGIIYLYWIANTEITFRRNIIRSTCSNTVYLFCYYGNKKANPNSTTTDFNSNSISSNVEIIDSSSTKIKRFMTNGFNVPIPTKSLEPTPTPIPPKTPAPSKTLIPPKTDSNQFSRSFDFSNSNPFSRTFAFSQSDRFTKSSQFSKSFDFSKSDHFNIIHETSFYQIESDFKETIESKKHESITVSYDEMDESSQESSDSSQNKIESLIQDSTQTLHESIESSTKDSMDSSQNQNELSISNSLYLTLESIDFSTQDSTDSLYESNDSPAINSIDSSYLTLTKDSFYEHETDNLPNSAESIMNDKDQIEQTLTNKSINFVSNSSKSNKIPIISGISVGIIILIALTIIIIVFILKKKSLHNLKENDHEKSESISNNSSINYDAINPLIDDDILPSKDPFLEDFDEDEL